MHPCVSESPLPSSPAGFFHQRSVDVHLANFHCNLTAAVHLTHHFYSLLLEKKLRGAIGVFASPQDRVATATRTLSPGVLWSTLLCKKKGMKSPPQGKLGCACRLPALTQPSGGFAVALSFHWESVMP